MLCPTSPFLLFLLLSLLLLVSPLYALPPRSEEKFYIYDWPDICAWLWCEGPENRGAGKLVNASNGVYSTYQYHLFNLMYARALRDPRRTLNPEEATSFLIPYDSHMDAMTLIGKDGKDELSWALGQANQAPKVYDLLQASPYFQRNKGKDHFMIIGWNGAMFFFILKPQAIPLFRLCNNCTKLVIEDFSFIYNRNDRSLPEEIEGDNW